MTYGNVWVEGNFDNHMSVTRTPRGLTVSVTDDHVVATYLLDRSAAARLSEAIAREVGRWGE